MRAVRTAAWRCEPRVRDISTNMRAWSMEVHGARGPGRQTIFVLAGCRGVHGGGGREEEEEGAPKSRAAASRAPRAAAEAVASRRRPPVGSRPSSKTSLCLKSSR